MGMGWDLLRRKALALLACAMLPAGGLRAGSGILPVDSMHYTARGRDQPWLSAEGADPLTVGMDMSAAEREGASLAPAQGHRGAEMYCLEFPDEDIIDGYVKGLLERKRDWLQQSLERSIRFRVVIALQLEQRGLPRELQYLPALESGFLSRATSPRGAGGLWQLMKNTASPYGLRMDNWLDERRDFWKATEASLKLLEENRRVFGDWWLALAAYNCGSTRLSQIIRQHGVRDYWALRRKGALPSETAAFVPQFLAIAKILSYPGRYGLQIRWEPSPAWARIPLDRSVDLRVLARESGVPYEVLTAGNAELCFPVTPPASYRYQLKVPEEHRPAIEEILSKAALPLVEFAIHLIIEGDTLSEIAEAYRVSVELIQEFNPTAKPLALQLGSKLLIPKPLGRVG